MFGIVFKRLCLALTALAFLGGTTVQAMSFAKSDGAEKPAMSMTTSGDCDQMGMSAHDSGTKMSMPCKSVNFDCLLKMGCSASALSFAAASYTLPMLIAHSMVGYSRYSVVRTGLSLAPDPFPPKTLA